MYCGEKYLFGSQQELVPGSFVNGNIKLRSLEGEKFLEWLTE